MFDRDTMTCKHRWIKSFLTYTEICADCGAEQEWQMLDDIMREFLGFSSSAGSSVDWNEVVSMPDRDEMMPEPWASIVDGVSANDAAWFKEHPQETMRLRDWVPGEWAGHDEGQYTDAPELPTGHHWERRVMVEQLQPGVRTRIAWGAAVPDA